MGLLTLAQVKSGPVGRSCGISTTTTDFVNIVNDATRQLMRRGVWWATLQPMVLPTNNGNIICPREVSSVMAIMNWCSGPPIPVQNLWYGFLEWNHFYCSSAVGLEPNTKVAYGVGTSPVFNQIVQTSPQYIRVVSSSTSDVGQQITFFGLDQNGFNTSCTLTLNGTTFASSYSQGIMFSQVTRVVKAITTGYVTAWQDNNAGTLLPLAYYEPTEMNPDYALMKVKTCTIPPNGQVFALVRLAFIPVYVDTDKVLIENQDALRDMVLSIRKKEAGDLQSAAALEKAAMYELNYQMRERFPDEQTVVKIRPFGVKDINTITGMI